MPKKSKSNYYVTNSELLEELKIYKHKVKIYESELEKFNKNKILEKPNWPGVGERLGEMIFKIAENLSFKGSFAGYSYREDFVNEAIYTTLKYIKNFDPEKSSNPFAYITQICRNSFIHYINKQHKHSHIKDVCFNNQELINQKTYISKGVDYSILVSPKRTKK